MRDKHFYSDIEPDSESSKEVALRLLEDRDFTMPVSDRLSLLLVYAKLRPACTSVIKSGDRENFHKIVSGLKLSYVEKTKLYPGEEEDQTISVLEVYIGQTQQEADALFMLFTQKRESHPDKNIDHDIGKALGFPESSLQAFNDNSKRAGRDVSLENLSIPEDVKKMHQVFPLFVNSSENFEKEILEYAKWMQAIKDISPSLYEAALQISATD